MVKQELRMDYRAVGWGIEMRKSTVKRGNNLGQSHTRTASMTHRWKGMVVRTVMYISGNSRAEMMNTRRSTRRTKGYPGSDQV